MISVVYFHFDKVIPFYVTPDAPHRLRWSPAPLDFIDLQVPITGLMQSREQLVISTLRGLSLLEGLWGTPEQQWIVSRVVDR